MIIRLNKTQLHNLIYLLICTFVMRGVYEIVYVSQIATIYHYEGYYNSFSFSRTIISFIMILVLLPFVYYFTTRSSFSSNVLLVLFFINFLPGTVLCSRMHLSYTFYWFLYYFVLYVSWFILPNVQRINKRAYMTTRLINIILVVFSIIIVFVWIVYAHGHIQLNIKDVYGIRLESRTYSIPLILKYLLSSLKVVFPVFFVWSINKKKYYMTTLVAVSQFVLFFIDGSKSTLFSLAVSLIGYYLLNENYSRIIHLPVFLTIVGIAADLQYRLFNSSTITTYIIRRIMFVPNFLNDAYYTFFSINQPDLFRSSLLRYFGFSSPYGNIAMRIGKYMSGSDSLSANNGLFSDAFGNLGYFGIVIMPVLIIVLLKLIDSFSFDLSIGTIIGSVTAFVLPLISSSFFTLLFTHGAIAMLIVFYFLPREKGLQNSNT